MKGYWRGVQKRDMGLIVADSNLEKRSNIFSCGKEFNFETRDVAGYVENDFIAALTFHQT